MIAVTEQVIQEMVKAIVREVDPEAIYLFGSRARNQPGSESDVDLLVVEREPFGSGRSRLEEITRISRALSEFRVPKDILVYTCAEVDYWRDSLNHVVAKCLREGRLLYARS